MKIVPAPGIPTLCAHGIHVPTDPIPEWGLPARLVWLVGALAGRAWNYVACALP